ncbi:MAG: hypothetical protein LBN34_09640 [Clostridiales Family XIII bacterium]|jgi:hypothetical protein|nr:hypothetical protein [Clostridiales Family XIII bacterium]
MKSYSSNLRKGLVTFVAIALVMASVLTVIPTGVYAEGDADVDTLVAVSEEDTSVEPFAEEGATISGVVTNPSEGLQMFLSRKEGVGTSNIVVNYNAQTGAFSFQDVSVGTYVIKFFDSSVPSQYYSESGAGASYYEATLITVSESKKVIQLSPIKILKGGTLSGNVIAPAIANVHVSFAVYQNVDPVQVPNWNEQPVSGGIVEEDGTFTTSRLDSHGLLPKSYYRVYFRAYTLDADNNMKYVAAEWYDDVFDAKDATPVTIKEKQTTTINADLTNAPAVENPENPTEPTAPAVALEPAPKPEITFPAQNGVAKYYKSGGVDFVIHIDRPLSLYDAARGITFNGSVLDEKHYKVEEGSTVVTIFDSYLKTLPVGNYSVIVPYTDGQDVSLTFEIAKGQPTTGDSSNMIPFMILIGAAFTGLAVTLGLRIRKPVKS